MGSYRIVSFLVPSFLAALCFLLQFSLAVDTIIPGKSLRTNETLVSQGETFVLGFFNTSIPDKLYLGIWYYKIPGQTIVWVGNRETPLTDSSGSLQITNNGTLVILNGEGTSIWSVHGPKVATNPTAKLLDSGNLIIIEAQDSVDNNGNFLWQSFDYPTHTLLPGMKIGIDLKTGFNRFLTSWKTADDPARGEFSYRLDHRGSPQFYIYDNSTPIYRTGPWIGNKFSGTPELGLSSVFNFSFIDNQDESYYIYFLVRKDIISRLAMAETGTMIRYTWSNENQAWSPLWRNPRDDCDNYEFCPAFANCNSNNQPYCNCLQGFEPRSIDQWNLRNFSGGCHRRTKLACGNGDGFLVIQNIKFPDTSMAQVEEGLSLVDCEAKCLSNCNCSGYGKTNVNGRDGCLIWYGDLVDLREFSDINQQFYVRVAASEVNRTSGGSNLGRKNLKTRERFIVIGAVTVISGALLLTLCIWYWWKRKKKEKPIIKVQEGSKKGQEALLLELRTGINKGAKENPYRNTVGESRHADSGVWFLELDDVIAATDNFSNANKVGKGGFGPVYKGHLPDGQEIAVKRLLTGSSQGLEEFKNEILLISKLQHKNLVRLLGCCVEQEEKILIYEYMTNKSLDHFIFDSDKSSLLDWGIRLNIMVGIARGLLYLHRDSRLRIIHRDLKASNVLLDDKMNPKIADFGMARIFGGDQTQAITCKVAGTHGYMSPEYLIDGRFSEKSDVFSFGVLILEIISGKRNREFYDSDHPLTLVEHVWNLWNEDRGLELVDPSMGDSYSTSQVLRFIHIGLLCVQEWAIDRPTMPSIFFMMSSESMALPVPKEPAFYKRRPTSETESSSNKRGTWSNCEITVSLEEGR